MITGPHTTGYWGEITKPEMDSLLARSRAIGWRQAVETLPQNMRDNIMNPDRAAFADVLPLAEGSRFLDIGAGLGAIATHMARIHQTVAVEGVAERARFIALRKQQDRLDNLTVVNSDFLHMPLAPGQFDCISVIGVLEWAGLFDLSLSPEQGQEKFMRTLRNLLAPGGTICLGIENRFGWAQLTGCLDHSGLPYTSLMPRWMARMVCRHSSQYRSSFNSGYRTYTYSYWGYEKLFRKCGLDIASFWIAPSSYHTPVTMIPMNDAAILSYVQGTWLQPETRPLVAWKNRFKIWSARQWFWRMFGSDYMFLLKASSDPHAPGDPH